MFREVQTEAEELRSLAKDKEGWDLNSQELFFSHIAPEKKCNHIKEALKNCSQNKLILIITTSVIEM